MFLWSGENCYQLLRTTNLIIVITEIDKILITGDIVKLNDLHGKVIARWTENGFELWVQVRWADGSKTAERDSELEMV